MLSIFRILYAEQDCKLTQCPVIFLFGHYIPPDGIFSILFQFYTKKLSPVLEKHVLLDLKQTDPNELCSKNVLLDT
jgi:hypothetical protein